MRIIIGGSGKIGSSLARVLSAEGHDLTLIDINQAALNQTQEKYDVMTVNGNCAMMSTLKNAGIMTADVLMAVTRLDEVNLLCCMTAHAMNPSVKTVARIRDPEYYDQIYEMRDSFALSLTFNPEFQTAREIARLLEYPGFLQRDSFVRDRAEIVEILIRKGSPLDGTKLIDLSGIVKCRVLVCAVLRDGKAYMPDGNFTLAMGDRIFVTASTKELTTLLKNLGILTRKVSRVLLAGGGRVSFYLAKQLIRAGISVQILEKDLARCEELAELLPEADIVQGDATSPGVLEQEGAQECDALVSLTGMDEMNIIISLYGHDLGLTQVITKVGRTESLGIVDRLSIGSALCPQDLVANIIIRYVRSVKNLTGAATAVHTIANGMAEAQEFIVDETTMNRGRMLKDISLRKNVLIVCISHHEEVEIPNGNSVFHTGDSIVVVTDTDRTVEQLNDIFI